MNDVICYSLFYIVYCLENAAVSILYWWVCMITGGLMVSYRYNGTLQLLMTANPLSQSLQVLFSQFLCLAEDSRSLSLACCLDEDDGKTLSVPSWWYIFIPEFIEPKVWVHSCSSVVVKMFDCLQCFLSNYRRFLCLFCPVYVIIIVVSLFQTFLPLANPVKVKPGDYLVRFLTCASSIASWHDKHALIP